MTLTPAQQKGFEIGKLYRVLDNGYTYADRNDVVEFVYDDGTFCPWFKKIQKAGSCTETFDGKLAIRLGDLKPYNPDTQETTYTIKNLSNQEILLMYVKQYYPEDRVMIAMVESL